MPRPRGRPRAAFLLPDGRVVRGAREAAAALGVTRAALYNRLRYVDPEGRHVVGHAARRPGRPPAVALALLLIALAAPAAARDVRPGPDASWWLVPNPPPAVRVVGGQGGLDCQPDATACTVWAQGAWEAVTLGGVSVTRRAYLPGVMR